MREIQIKGLRSLVDTGIVKISPLTFLVGQNSSGKSTFLRTFPLLRQSVEANNRGPLSFYGRLVDFGSFQDSISNYNDVEKIEIGLELCIPERDYGTYYWREASASEGEEIVASTELSFASHGDTTRLDRAIINFENSRVSFDFGQKNEFTHLTVNGTCQDKWLSELDFRPSYGLIPHIIWNDDIAEKDIFFRQYMYSIGRDFSSGLKHIVNVLRGYTSKKLGDIKLLQASRKITEIPHDRLLLSFKRSKTLGAVWRKKVRNWSEESPEFLEIKSVLTVVKSIRILARINRMLTATFGRVRYIGPVRATAERYYRLQSLGVEEVDVTGKNLPELLRSMTEMEASKFRSWTRQHFDFEVYARSSAGHVSITMKEGEDSAEINLTDKGFGFSQLLPIIAQLWLLVLDSRKQRVRKRQEKCIVDVCCIEQPELHLHPKFQALMTDIFIAVLETAKIKKIDLRLIVETHSQAMINRAGACVAAKKLDRRDTSIVIFDKRRPSDPTEVRTAEYDDDGFLTNWPFGFFDPESEVL